MTSEFALQLLAQTLFAGVVIAGPVLGFALLVGLLVSILQVVTQVQDVSLAFVPKIIAVVATIAIFGPWMLRKLLAFSSTLVSQIPLYL